MLAFGHRSSRVFVEDFAAKLPTPPQFTVCALRLFKRWSGCEEFAPGRAQKGSEQNFVLAVCASDGWLS